MDPHQILLAAVRAGDLDRIRALAPTAQINFFQNVGEGIIDHVLGQVIEDPTKMKATIDLLISLGANPIYGLSSSALYSAHDQFSYLASTVVFDSNSDAILVYALEQTLIPTVDLAFVIETLIRRGANPNQVVTVFGTKDWALNGSIFGPIDGARQLTDLLIAFGADYRLIIGDQDVAASLIGALIAVPLKVRADLLFRAGFNANLNNPIIHTIDSDIISKLPLDDREQLVKLILDGGALIGQSNGLNALLANQPTMVEADDFISNKSPLTRVDKDGYNRDILDNDAISYFHFLAARGYRESVKYYLDHADRYGLTKRNLLDLVDDQGLTPLIYAIVGGAILVVKHLVNEGADLLVTNINGFTAYDYAIGFDGSEVVKQALIDIIGQPFRNARRNVVQVTPGGSAYRMAARQPGFAKPGWYRPIPNPEIARVDLETVALTNPEELPILAARYGVPVDGLNNDQIRARLIQNLDLSPPTDFSGYYNYDRPARFYLSSSPVANPLTEGEPYGPGVLSPLQGPDFIAGFVWAWDIPQNRSDLKVFVEGYPQPQKWWTLPGRFFGSLERGVFHFGLINDQNRDQAAAELERQKLPAHRGIILPVAGGPLSTIIELSTQFNPESFEYGLQAASQLNGTIEMWFSSERK